MVTSSDSHDFVMLETNNWNKFSGALQACVMGFGIWGIVTGDNTCPTTLTVTTATTGTAAVTQDQVNTRDDRIQKWKANAERVSGEILKCLPNTQRHKYLPLGGDPPKLWEMLKSNNQTQSPVTRFHAVQRLLNLSQFEEESLTSFMDRVIHATDELYALIPIAPAGSTPTVTVTTSTSTTIATASTPKPLTVQDLVQEIGIHAALNGIDNERFGPLISSILLMPSITRETVTLAFKNEEITRSSNAVNAHANAARTRPPPPRATGNRDGIGKNFTCNHCGKTGHSKARCWDLNTSQRPDGWRPRTRKAGAAKDDGKPMESAGSASPRPSSSSVDDADVHWNTDTGASSHMTPHRQWLRGYQPHRIPIQLANNEIVYSAGVGSVMFAPVVEGKPSRNVLFTRVLHVPALQNNLLSVFHLTERHGYSAKIEKDRMVFNLGKDVLFQATVRDGVGYLDGDTVPCPEYANFSSMPRPDIHLLHRRLAHIGEGRLRRLIREKMAEGIEFMGGMALDPICEPCIAAKQQRGAFPKATTHRASKPLELVVSDLKGPLPVRDREGHRYWITFTCDNLRYRWVLRLKRKDQTFEAYKIFEALAENQTGYTIKVFRDDKGGEYMSKEMKLHLQKHGIHHEHTIVRTPEQNGISEKTNQTLSKGIMAMLQQANLPSTFWGEALALFVRIMNATPTSSLPDVTPYEALYHRKPDLSMLRTFGCLAYVHVHSEARKALESHTRKCIYMGFEDGYKGFKCYDIAAKKMIISRDVVFNEDVFPGLSTKNIVDFTPIHVEEEVPHVEEEPNRQPEEDDEPVIVSHQPPPPPPPGGPPSLPPYPQLLPPYGPPATPPSVPPSVPPPPPPPSTLQSQLNFGPPRSPPRVLPDSDHDTDSDSDSDGAPPDDSPRRLRRQPSPPQTPARVDRSPPAAPTSNRYFRLQPDQADLDAADSEEEVAEEVTGDSPIAQRRSRREGAGNILKGTATGGKYKDFERSDKGPPPAGGAAAKASELQALDFVYSLGDYFDYFDAMEHAWVSMVKSDDAPKTYTEAISGPDGAKWKRAAEDEMNALIENGTWELTRLPNGRKPVASKWVFKIKHNADGSVDHYKARLVAKGFSQRPSIDFQEVFSPTARWAALCAILVLAAYEGAFIESVDISNAYLNGELGEEIRVFMEQAEGFHQGASRKRNRAPACSTALHRTRSDESSASTTSLWRASWRALLSSGVWEEARARASLWETAGALLQVTPDRFPDGPLMGSHPLLFPKIIYFSFLFIPLHTISWFQGGAREG